MYFVIAVLKEAVFRLVSEGYIHVVMDGEAMELIESNAYSIKKIVRE
jgi:hypothetical protein